MKIISAIAVLTATLVALGDAAPQAVPAKAKPKFSPMYRKTGGMLQRPGVKPGRVAVFNAQKSVATAEIEPTVKWLEKHVHVEMPILEQIVPDDVTGRIAAARKSGANFALFLVEEDKNPCSLGIFPDQKIAFVNVAALRLDGGEGAFLMARTRKELVRAFLTLCGGASSQSAYNMMGGMKSIRDLDKFEDDAIPVDVVGRTQRFLPDSGCNIRTMVPYRTACKEGWAPPPTNDVQKAIWEKVKADKERGPTNPITIQPPKAK